MFRFTIRDVLWLTALLATRCAWWTEHRASAGMTKDAEMMAHLSAPGGIRCFVQLEILNELQAKYGAPTDEN